MIRNLTTRARWMVLGLLLGTALVTLYAQEPQVFQRGIAIIRGNLTMAGRTGNQIEFEGGTADANETVITATEPTADRTFFLPDDSGIAALTAPSYFVRRAVSDSATMLGTETILAYTALASTTAPTVRLLSAANLTGLYVIIKNETSGTTTITILPSQGTSQTIDGGTSARITTAYAAYWLYSNGVNWMSTLLRTW